MFDELVELPLSVTLARNCDDKLPMGMLHPSERSQDAFCGGHERQLRACCALANAGVERRSAEQGMQHAV